MTNSDEQQALADRLRKRGHQIEQCGESVNMPGGEETCLVVDGIPRTLTELRGLEQQESEME